MLHIKRRHGAARVNKRMNSHRGHREHRDTLCALCDLRWLAVFVRLKADIIYGGLRMRVRDSNGTVRGASAT
jgi:hypothetical protein